MAKRGRPRLSEAEKKRRKKERERKKIEAEILQKKEKEKEKKIIDVDVAPAEVFEPLDEPVYNSVDDEKSLSDEVSDLSSEETKSLSDTVTKEARRAQNEALASVAVLVEDVILSQAGFAPLAQSEKEAVKQSFIDALSVIGSGPQLPPWLQAVVIIGTVQVGVIAPRILSAQEKEEKKESEDYQPTRDSSEQAGEVVA